MHTPTRSSTGLRSGGSRDVESSAPTFSQCNPHFPYYTGIEPATLRAQTRSLSRPQPCTVHINRHVSPTKHFSGCIIFYLKHVSHCPSRNYAQNRSVNISSLTVMLGNDTHLLTAMAFLYVRNKMAHSGKEYTVSYIWLHKKNIILVVHWNCVPTLQRTSCADYRLINCVLYPCLPVACIM